MTSGSTMQALHGSMGFNSVCAHVCRGFEGTHRGIEGASRTAAVAAVAAGVVVEVVAASGSGLHKHTMHTAVSMCHRDCEGGAQAWFEGELRTLRRLRSAVNQPQTGSRSARLWKAEAPRWWDG